MITYVILTTFLSLAVSITNMFTRQINNPPWNNWAYGYLFYNISEYRPTCGWKIMLTSSYPLCSIMFWDGNFQQIDDYTFILTNLNYVANTDNKMSDLAVNGLFLNTWPSITANYLCVCNASTLNVCQSVAYETESHTNNSLSTVPCASSNTFPTTTLASTPRTPKTSAITPTTPTSPSSQSLTISDIFNQTQLSFPNSFKLSISVSVCYIGSMSVTVSNILQFVDCCTVCLIYTACQGINYHTTAKKCDLITVDTTGSNQLKQVTDCTYWKVISRG